MCRVGGFDAIRRLIFVVMTAVLLATVVATAPALADDDCETIETTGAGQGAPPQPGDAELGIIRTVAVIDSGILEGTTEAAFQITGVTPDGTGVTFAGELTFTTIGDTDDDGDGDGDDGGTLTLALTGSLDLTNGDFESSGPVIAATGELSGATETLTLSGNQDLTDPAGSFTETVTGELCFDDDDHDDDDDDDDHDDDHDDDDDDD